MLRLQQTSNALIISFEDIENIDARVSARFKSELKDSLTGSQAHLIVDLSGIKFIDSSGFGMLISLLKQIRVRNGRMVFCNVHSDVIEVMELLQLESVFSVKADTAEALASLQ